MDFLIRNTPVRSTRPLGLRDLEELHAIAVWFASRGVEWVYQADFLKEGLIEGPSELARSQRLRRLLIDPVTVGDKVIAVERGPRVMYQKSVRVTCKPTGLTARDQYAPRETAAHTDGPGATVPLRSSLPRGSWQEPLPGDGATNEIMRRLDALEAAMRDPRDQDAPPPLVEELLNRMMALAVNVETVARAAGVDVGGLRPLASPRAGDATG